ncbi:MAG: aldo/keto reductase, partial [Candidatus Poribacteria bacterium]
AGRLRTGHVAVMLCHEGNIEDPTVYVEGFEALRAEGSIRYYGISTNSLAVLRSFHDTSDGACAVVEVDYSLLNREPETALLDYCIEKDLGVLVRGPLAKGVLSGRYGEDSVFTDTVRSRWNKGESGRASYEKMLADLETVKAVVGDDSTLVETSLRFVTSHAAHPVAIPGATRSEQSVTNGAAGAALLDDATYQRLRATRS